MSIILATQEAEIKRITEVQSQPGEKSSKKTLSRKTHHQKGLVERLKFVSPKFNPQYHK
jgi:hypothetical protein